MTEPATAPELTLPSQKTTPSLALERSPLWIYGQEGAGKTLLGTSMAEDALLLAADPRYKHLSVFAQEIDSWQTFGAVLKALKQSDAHSILVVDRVEQLYDMCLTRTMEKMGRAHPGDAEDFGQGWQAVNAAFASGIGALCALGRGVVFLSHEKTEKGKGFQEGNDKFWPNATGGCRKFIGGLVDFGFRLEVGDGGARHLRTVPDEFVWAKRTEVAGGTPLPDLIPVPADDPAGPLREALKAAMPS